MSSGSACSSVSVPVRQPTAGPENGMPALPDAVWYTVPSGPSNDAAANATPAVARVSAVPRGTVTA